MVPDDDTEDIEIRLVLEAIFSKYGYDLRQYSYPSMRRRVRAALAKSGVAHLGEFQHRLLHSREFFASVFEGLTVQVSEMFRDPSFYRAFRASVLPFLRTYPQLKIWHAGCAGGEEVYATAIMLAEEGLYDRAVIYATDVSTVAVERAREGVYSEAEAALFADNYSRSGGSGNFSDHFSHGYGRVVMKPALRKNVVYFQHDLAVDHGLGVMHVIFCRNVLIYFTSSLRARVLTIFAQSLSHGGFLCLGSSERPSTSGEGFEEFVADERIYRIRDGQKPEYPPQGPESRGIFNVK